MHRPPKDTHWSGYCFQRVGRTNNPFGQKLPLSVINPYEMFTNDSPPPAENSAWFMRKQRKHLSPWVARGRNIKGACACMCDCSPLLLTWPRARATRSGLVRTCSSLCYFWCAGRPATERYFAQVRAERAHVWPRPVGEHCARGCGAKATALVFVLAGGRRHRCHRLRCRSMYVENVFDRPKALVRPLLWPPLSTWHVSSVLPSCWYWLPRLSQRRPRVVSERTAFTAPTRPPASQEPP